MPDEITFGIAAASHWMTGDRVKDGIVPQLLHYQRELLALQNQEFEIGWHDERPDLPRNNGLLPLVAQCGGTAVVS
jgi:hypothetical protein